MGALVGGIDAERHDLGATVGQSASHALRDVRRQGRVPGRILRRLGQEQQPAPGQPGSGIVFALDPGFVQRLPRDVVGEVIGAAVVGGFEPVVGALEGVGGQVDPAGGE
ncbi:hypothetical protein, partial [Streptomyces chryseus]|uniref:hypothetical protein n=1 Tax=Streptomyces chryseus TaxID=68186 RepID=UPI001E47FE89